MIIAGFAGIGKTYLSKKYKNVIDLESSDYKWIYDEEIKDKEKRKGITDRKFNLCWPDNYIDDIVKNEKKYDIVLISQSIDVLAELRIMKIPFLVAIPKLENKQEYIKRCKDRGNNETFITFIDNYYEHLITKLMKRNDHKIVLEYGEYLEDVVLKLGYLKKENRA